MESTRFDLSGQIILIVEDEPMLALNLQLALEEAGAEVVIARAQHDALARLGQFAFSVAIVDPMERSLIQELAQQGLYVVIKPTNRTELLARLAAFRH
jgi:ActR/RegA family two-component response regulator